MMMPEAGIGDQDTSCTLDEHLPLFLNKELPVVHWLVGMFTATCVSSQNESRVLVTSTLLVESSVMQHGVARFY